MTRKNRHLAFGAAAASLVLLAACAQPTPYQPRDARGGTGYSDAQLSATRYRVTFTGNSVTSREQVEDFLLRRAAEVTLQSGFSHFMFDTRNTEARTNYYANFSRRWPGSNFGAAWYWRSWGYDPFDPWADRFGSERLDPVTRYQAYAEIVMLRGPQAADEPTALEARDVLARLTPPPAPQ
jgi:hypothetical protein